MRAKILTFLAGISGGAILLAVVGILVFGGEWRAFRTIKKDLIVPVVAPPTKAEEKAPPKVLPDRDVQATDPAPKARKKIAETYNRPDLTAEAVEQLEVAGVTPAEIIGEKEIRPLKNGGTGLLTIEPSGEVRLTVVATPEKFFRWSNEWEAGLGISPFGDPKPWKAWGAVYPVHLRRVDLGLMVDLSGRGGEMDPAVLIVGKIGSR
jgi:hypothetical protein